MSVFSSRFPHERDDGIEDVIGFPTFQRVDEEDDMSRETSAAHLDLPPLTGVSFDSTNIDCRQDFLSPVVRKK